MSFRSFFIKNVLMPFFTITACVSVAMGILGMIFYSDIFLPYSVLFAPALYGIATSFPSLIMYSKNELTVRQVVIRKIIQGVTIEATVLLLNLAGGNIKNASVAVSIAVTVLVIMLAVNAIRYINDKRVASELNEALKKINKRGTDR
ncbi:MAG: hypothetical protein Q4F95_08255 [Oscillospiraceae bacterium]|nr:hypothetical protein [Oscillospiraceae bacterium]